MEQDFALSVVEMGGLVASFLLPLFRISSFFLAAPIFGAQLIPPRVKLVLAIAVTALIMPVIPDPPKVDALSATTILLIAEQIFIGLGMAFILQMLMQVFVMGGQIAAMQMGLGFASMMDPVNGVSVTVISQFYLMLITLLYISMDGHLATLQIFIESFSAIPIGTTLGPDFFMQLVSLMSWCLAGALLIALPAVTALPSSASGPGGDGGAAVVGAADRPLGAPVGGAVTITVTVAAEHWVGVSWHTV